MKDLEVGQILVLKMRFNNKGAISSVKHPYLIVYIDEEWNTVEIAQIDSLQGKEYKAMFRSNKVVYSTDPKESVIDKDSFVQLDNKFVIEYFDDLAMFRQRKDKLSPLRLNDVINAYNNYHLHNEIDEMKNVYIEKAELLQLNK